MKFRRMHAAILSALMITSCMSFVAGAEEADAEAVIEEIAEEAEVEETEEPAEETVEEFTEEPAEELEDEAEEAPIEEEEASAEEEAEETEENAEEEAALAAETVTITFNRRNGAKNATITTADFEVGAKVTFPENPTYVYHTFKGWSETIGGTVIDTSSITATEAKTYYAVWEYTHTGKILGELNAKNNAKHLNGEGATASGPYYDAVNNKIFKRFLTATSGKSGSCNMYSGLNYSIAGTEFYMTALVRTNMVGDAGTAGVYQTTNKNGGGMNSSMTQTNKITEDQADKWVKVILKSNTIPEFGVGIHIDYDVTGAHPATNVGTDYYDVVGMALFNTLAEAEAYSFASVEASNYNVYFDLNYEGADVLETAPATAPVREGYKLTGWATDAAGGNMVDLTRVPVPTANVTYYAIWEKVHTINFHKNDGSGTVETYSDLLNGTAITVPEFKVDGKTFLGWATEADSTEIVEVDATASADRDYYAVWTSMWLTELVVNGNDFNAMTKSGTLYGIKNLAGSQRLDIVMPYDYPTSVVPTITGKSNVGTVTYTAPENFDAEGSVTITSGETSVVLPVTFTVADKSTVHNLTFIPEAGVNSSGMGLYAIKNNTDKGISATKFIPIYSEDSEYYKKTVDANGAVTGGYLPDKIVNIEGWAAFDRTNGVNLESYDQYRALIYYDAGANGKRDVTAVPSITTTNHGTRGPLKNKATSLISGEYKTGRWEYIYFDNESLNNGIVYGWSTQFSIGLFGSAPAQSFTDDVLYVAKIELLVDGDEKFLQYEPTQLSATAETEAGDDGTISGVTSDMEIAVNGGEYVAATEFEGFNAETGVISGLDGDTYSVRYAADETHAASEAVEIVVVPYDIELTFYSNIDDTTTVFATKQAVINATADIVPLMSDYKGSATSNDIPAHPARVGYWFKGWAKSPDATEAEAVVATEDASYYAVWEKTTVLEEGKDYGLTVVADAAQAGIPENATFFAVGTAEGGNFFTNTTGIKRNAGAKLEGITNATTSSYFGGGDQTTTLGKTPAIWYKWQDGSQVQIKPGVSGIYNVAFRIFANGNDEGTTTRGFYLEAGDVAGTVHLENCAKADASKDRLITFRANFTEDSVLAYSAARDFDDVVIEGAQFLGVYIWPATNVYLDQVNGNDANDGLTPETAVKSIKAAQTLLANDSLNTIVVVGQFLMPDEDANNKIGHAGKTVTITGFDENASFVLDNAIDGTSKWNDERLLIQGTVVFENITLIGDDNDGRIETNANKFVIGKGVKYGTKPVSENNTIAIAVQTIPTGKTAEIEIQSGKVHKILTGTFNGGTVTGTTNVKVTGAEASVGNITISHNYNGTAERYGIVNVTVDAGEVSAIGLTPTGVVSVASYDGLRYFTINGGNVSTVELAGVKSKTGIIKEVQVTKTATLQSGVTVVEINGGNVTTIMRSVSDIDDTVGVVIFNNGTYADGIVTDPTATVIAVENGSLKAQTTEAYASTATANEIKEWCKNVEITGYSYTTDAANKYININGTNYSLADFTNVDEAALTEEVTVLIPADLFEAGKTYTAVFSETPLYTVTWKDGETIINTETVAGGTKLTPPTYTKAPDKQYYKYNVSWTSDVEGFDLETYTVTSDITINAVTTPVEGCEMPDVPELEFASFGRVNDTSAAITSELATVDGVNAVHITPKAAETNYTIALEGWGKLPYNYSTGSNVQTVDTDIYEYYAVKYYYDAGTNTDTRKITVNMMNGGDGDVAETMESGKWSYVVGKFKANGTVQQFHITPMDGIGSQTLVANGESIYIDKIILFKSQPSVITVTFADEQGDKLSAVEAINGEAVVYGGEEVTKTGYTFKGWAKAGTTEVVENLAFTENTTLVPVFESNKHNVIYMLDGAEYSKTEVVYGEAVEILPAPEAREGYTFSGWSKTEAFTMPDEDVTITGTFTKNAPAVPTTPTYKTYGKYDSLNGKYTVEVKFVGANVNQGSFGFNFPADEMTFKSVQANADAGIELLGNVSPIYAKGEGYYADTWAVSDMASAGHIDATNEEILIATFEFSMTKAQREAFTAGTLANGKFAEYTAVTSEKYYNGTNYIVTIHAGDFSFDRQAVVYESHTDEEVASDITYTTYGKYDEYNETYSIDIKVKGAKINLGAFGLAFNEEYMTFDPEAENAVVLAENIANYLGITLHNDADGYAFAFDGSSMADGYVDASEEEVLLATINLKMTKAQREAFENAGKTMSIYVPTASDNIDAVTLAKYFDGENYLVSIYVPGLATPKLPAIYASHSDEVKEATVADVKVEVTFASKNGATNTNIAQIKLDDGEAVALEEKGNEEATLSYTYKALEIGKTYTVTVEKNGYIAGVAEIEVVKGSNEIKMTLIAGDIKGAATAVCGDGKVDLSDFVRVIRAFDENTSADFEATVDIDESGAVNVTDISIIKSNFNKTAVNNIIIVNGLNVNPIL